MALTESTLARIERNLDDLVKPTIPQLREMVAEIRASRTELRTLNQLAVDVSKAHADLGDALRKAGEVR